VAMGTLWRTCGANIHTMERAHPQAQSSRGRGNEFRGGSPSVGCKRIPLPAKTKEPNPELHHADNDKVEYFEKNEFLCTLIRCIFLPIPFLQSRGDGGGLNGNKSPSSLD